MNPIEMNQEEKDLAKSGRRVDAIKHLRQRVNCGLSEAKGIVDAFCLPLLREQEIKDMDRHRRALDSIQYMVEEINRLNEELRRVSKLVIYDDEGKEVTQFDYDALVVSYRKACTKLQKESN